jgi:CRP/FNR family transcriptional regulator
MIDQLSRFSFLGEMTPIGRAKLAEAARIVRLPPGSAVLHRGDEVAGAYLVERGALRIYYVGADGREGTLYWVDPGQSCILALNCLFSRLAYPAWVETDDAETEVAVIGGDAYRELFLSEPAVQRFTFDSLASRLLDLMTLMQETASLGLEQRVAAHLLRRAKGTEVLETTHEQIAHHLGSSREVVSRVLRNIARSGALDLSPRVIAIRDEEKLRDLAQSS